MDYQVYYDEGNNLDWFLLESSVLTQEYTALSLSSGVTYKFKVRARNSVGFSLFSAEISALAAQIPDAPENVSTSIDGLNVIVSWDLLYDGGTPVIAYLIKLRTSDGSTFVEDATNCDG